MSHPAWPEFRGPTGQGHSSAKDLPVQWSETNNIRWRVEMKGNGWSSPVVVDRTIYLTSADTGEAGALTMNVMAYALDSGKLKWNTIALEPSPEVSRSQHKKNSQASPTPLVRDGKLYAHFGHFGTAALDLTGKVLWRQTNLNYSPVHGNGGSPVWFDGQIIYHADAGKDPFVVSLDATTGVVKWKIARDVVAQKTFSFSTPLIAEIDGKAQLISPGSGYVASYDPRNGKEYWRVRYGEGYSVVPRPVFAQGLIFIGTGYDRPSVLAISPLNASGDVTDSRVVWRTNKGAPNTPSTLVVGEELYFVSDSGVATCADAKTGQVHWNERLGGDFSASPIFGSGRIYFFNESGTGFVLRPGKSFQVEAKNELNERTLASPAPIDGALIVRTESHLVRIGQ